MTVISLCPTSVTHVSLTDSVKHIPPLCVVSYTGVLLDGEYLDFHRAPALSEVMALFKYCTEVQNYK